MARPRVGINHVAVEVDDIDEALEFFGRIFEIRLRGSGTRMAFIDIGDQFIALVDRPPAAARTAQRHIGLVVDDRPRRPSRRPRRRARR